MFYERTHKHIKKKLSKEREKNNNKKLIGGNGYGGEPKKKINRKNVASELEKI